jgi:RNA polymerase sigma-70 factor (ECF subfamily)
MQETYNTRETLIRRVQNPNDEQSWQEFVLIYRKFIYAIIRSLNISEHDANDILQQVIIKLWGKLPETDAADFQRFRSYLSTITRNCAIDFIRERSKNREQLENCAYESTLPVLTAITQPELDKLAEEEWEIHLTSTAVTNLSSQFSGKAMQVFQMSMEGESIEAISNKLNLKTNSVYRLRNRVKERVVKEIQRLRAELE